MREREAQIVLDFDNFLTDGEKEKFAYQDIYVRKFAAAFSLPFTEIRAEFESVEMDIQKHPDQHLYTVNRVTVGPGTSDHMLLTYSTAKQLLSVWRGKQYVQTPETQEADIAKFIQLYRESYPKTGTIYRYGARDLVADLHKTGRLSIVSGSDTPHVRKKLVSLLQTTGIDTFELDVHGNAGKSFVDLSIPAPFYIPWNLADFPYPIYFHRPIFERVIASLPNHVSVAASDQYSGDLSQYEHMGAYTILLETPLFTVPWEIPIYTAHPNGIRVQSLEEVRNALDIFV